MKGVSTRHRLGALVVFFIAFPRILHAQVVVTEIMYDLKSGSDSGREWIEVYNASAVAIALSDWKLFENGTNHKIVASAGGSSLAPGSYAVIADNPGKFKADWPDFSGQLFDSAFSLGNAGETIALRAGTSTEVNSVSYESSWGAAGDGNSLNRAPTDAGQFVPRTPSPGGPMAATAIAPPSPKVPAVSAKPASKKTSASNVQPSATFEGEVDPSAEVSPDVQAAGAAETTPAPDAPAPSYIWWFAAAALALLACGALVAARHVGKREWNIVEETSD